MEAEGGKGSVGGGTWVGEGVAVVGVVGWGVVGGEGDGEEGEGVVREGVGAEEEGGDGPVVVGVRRGEEGEGGGAGGEFVDVEEGVEEGTVLLPDLVGLVGGAKAALLALHLNDQY